MLRLNVNDGLQSLKAFAEQTMCHFIRKKWHEICKPDFRPVYKLIFKVNCPCD